MLITIVMTYFVMACGTVETPEQQDQKEQEDEFDTISEMDAGVGSDSDVDTWYNIEYESDIFVIIAGPDTGNRRLISSDGKNWTAQSRVH